MTDQKWERECVTGKRSIILESQVIHQNYRLLKQLRYILQIILWRESK